MKKESPNGHKRNVSWGALTQKLQQPELVERNSSHASSSSNNYSGRITQDVLAARTPVENEAESYVVNSLENRDPTGAGRSEKSILSNITDTDLQALNSGDSASVASGKSAGRRTAARQAGKNSSSKKSFFKVANAVRAQQQHHRRKETIGDKLQGLAAAMDAVNLQHLDFLNEDVGPPIKEIPAMDTKPVSSSAEAFQRNTNLLYQRHSQRFPVGDVETPASPYVSTTPADIQADKGEAAQKRWRMLKYAVAATTMAHKEEEENDDNNDVHMDVSNGTERDDDKNEKANSEGSGSSSEAPKGKRTRKDRKARNTAEKVLRDLQDFVTPRQFSTYYFFKIGVFFLMLPSAGIAAILYYFAVNPPTGVVDLNRSAAEGSLFNESGDPISPDTASVSWWLLFLGVREVAVLLLAKFFELFFIDFLSVRSKFSVKVFGPWATLFILQTKG